MNIITSGRTDLQDYFKHVNSYEKLSHTPFIVFCETELKKVVEERIKILQSKKSTYEWEISGESEWAKANKNTDRGKQCILEAKEALALTKLEIKNLKKMTGDSVTEVRIIDNKEELLALPDETPVMSQWSGQWRSDFFHFTVGDFRKFINHKE
jgi:hypothetical protein